VLGPGSGPLPRLRCGRQGGGASRRLAARLARRQRRALPWEAARRTPGHMPAGYADRLTRHADSRLPRRITGPVTVAASSADDPEVDVGSPAAEGLARERLDR